MYGRTFFVVSCGRSSREYLTGALGLEVAPDGAYPDDPIDGYRATLKKDTSANPYPPAPRDDVLAAYIEAAAERPSNALAPDKLKKFLANDPKGAPVLRRVGRSRRSVRREEFLSCTTTSQTIPWRSSRCSE